MVSPLAVTKFDESDTAVVVVVVLLVAADLVVVGILELVLDGDDRLIYKGWDLNDGRPGNCPHILPESASTTHFMLGRDCVLWSVHSRLI